MIDQMTVTLYTRVRSRGWRSQVWSALTGRSHCLLPLAQVDAADTVHARRGAGIQTVPIRQIRGSEGRSRDFDRDFNPLQSHTRDRWLSIAGALQRGRVLPPVELIQVRDVYFVCDGHHRISVARALGQLDIEARVMVWQVSGPLPWERAASAHSLAGQEMGIRQLFRKVRDDSIRLREYLLVCLRALVAAAGMRSRGQIVPCPDEGRDAAPHRLPVGQAPTDGQADLWRHAPDGVSTLVRMSRLYLPGIGDGT